MSTLNQFAKLRRLLPGSPLLVCTVISSGSGGATVALPGGSHIAVRGEAAVGSSVFVQDNAIQGTAPSLPSDIVEV